MSEAFSDPNDDTNRGVPSAGDDAFDLASEDAPRVAPKAIPPDEAKRLASLRERVYATSSAGVRAPARSLVLRSSCCAAGP